MPLFLNNVNLNYNELQNVRMQSLATAPSSPSKGQLYFDSTLNSFRGWDGTKWTNFGQELSVTDVITWVNAGVGTINDSKLSANVNDAITKKHAQNTDTTLTGGAANTINTTGAGNIVDYKVNGTIKTSIDTNGGFTGNSASATKLATGRTIATSGDVTGTATSFDGTANITIPLTLANSGVTAGTYPKVTVDAKGRVTSGSTMVEADIPTITASKISNFDTQVRTSTLNQMAVPTADLSMNSKKITNVADPVNAQDAVTKSYADNLRAGITLKDPVRVATTANITLSGTQTIDGVSVIDGDRVLVKDQTDSKTNGIYIAKASTWIRSVDCDNSPVGEVVEGLTVWVNDGTVNASTRWVLTSNNPITLGTSTLTFTKDFQGVDLIPGTGLSKSGNTLSLSTSGVTAGTYSKVVVDTLGRVTNGSQLTLSDIVTVLGSAPTTTLVCAVGNGTAKSFTIPLDKIVTEEYKNTVICQIFNNSTGELVYPDVKIIFSNGKGQIVIDFAIPPVNNEYRAVVSYSVNIGQI